MDSDTTTSDSDIQAVEEPQLDNQEQNTEAVNEETATSQTSEESDSEPNVDNSETEEFSTFAKSKGFDPTALTENERKAVEMARNAEKHMHEATKKKEGQLKTAVSAANASSDTENYQALKNEVEALSFWVNHPDAKQFESTMVDILEEKPWLASDLDVVLDVAKGRSTTDAATRLAERQAGSKEALAQAEQAGRAAQPRASATNSAKASNTRITMDNVDQLIEANGHEWYMKNRDKINTVLANG